MSAPGFTPISLYYSTTAAATPSASNLANGELALNITDGKLFYKDNGGTVQVLATKAGASGDVVGPGSSTNNALVRFDSTTGKLVKNSVGILDDSGNLTGIAALTTSGAVTLSAGTANGVAYLNGSKQLTTGSALTFDGATFTSGAHTLSTGNLNFGGTAQRITGDFSNTTPASRLAFQSSITNGNTGVYAIPNGTSTTATWLASNSSDVSNAAIVYIQCSADEARIISNRTSESVPFLPMTFSTGGSERMRLDTSGNLGIGTTSVPSSFKMGIAGNLCLQNSNGYGYVQYGTDTTAVHNWYVGSEGNGDFRWYIGNLFSGTIRMYLTNDGAAYNTTGTWGTISDARLKENVVDAGNYLDRLMQVRVVKYSMKEEQASQPTKLGVIAQELQALFPGLVHESEYPVEADPEGPNELQVKMSVFIPMLIKAVQELKAEINTLKGNENVS